jgi:hypothetical protein
MPDDLILMFAYHFPPENAIGAARPYRFYKYLRRLGYRVHVITAADVSGRPDLDAQTVDDPFFMRARQGIGWQMERAIRKALLPGAIGTQWAVHASRAAVRLIRNEPSTRTTVVSTFPPLGAHLAAYWVRRRLGVPWVADYRDPLTANPIYDDWSDFRKATCRKVERVFMGAADAVIANTDSARDRLVANYPARASHIHLIWNGFDPEQRLHPLPSESNDRLVVSHVGELYGGRDISPILHSIKRLSRNGRLETARLKVQLVGPTEESAIPDPEFMQAGEAEGWLSLTPERVPLSEAQMVVRKSDALLLVQPHSLLQVPGKLFEYLQTGRPILAYVPRNSPIERILQNSGVPHECIYTGSEAEEVDASVERFFNLNRVQSLPNRWFENEFNAENQSRKLSDLIQELHLGALVESVAR